MADDNTKGRKANAAQDLGDHKGQVSNKDRDATGRESTRRAGPDGPDGPDAKTVGDTFKQGRG